MHEHDKQIPIWFFIGALLAVYGAIIAGYGMLTLGNPPPPTIPEQIYRLHAPVWWGLMMVALGMFYVVRFWPSKTESLTGRISESQPPPPGGNAAPNPPSRS